MTEVLKKLQRDYVFRGLGVVPALPFLYLQGQLTRYRVGRLPDAEGENAGEIEGDSGELSLLAIGESTVAGVGVETLDDALGARFAHHLSLATRATVRWQSFGVSGITVKRVLAEIEPDIPEREYDVILIALGGNDVFELNSPVRFRKGMEELIGRLRNRSPESTVFLANVPMIRDAIGLPHPLKYVLSRFAKIQHFDNAARTQVEVLTHQR